MTDEELMTSPRFEFVRDRFAEACKASRDHTGAAAWYLATYGDHGPLISGCVRDHFPTEAKDHLRELAARCSRWSALAYAARPKGVHKATIRRIGQLIAARDGAGYYGPQPIRWET